MIKELKEKNKTMTDKQKIEEAKRLYKTANAEQKYLLESLFPELFVSEDERIRSEIIRYINLHKNDERKSDEWIAWIGKQGDNKSKQDVYEQGYKDAIDKAFDLLIERYENQGVILLEDINELKQTMEE